MTRLGRLIDRVRRNRLLDGSLALNAVLLMKIAVFDPNLEFKLAMIPPSLSMH